MSLLTQESVLEQLKKQKQIQNLYNKEMAKIVPYVPDAQALKSNFIVSGYTGDWIILKLPVSII